MPDATPPRFLVSAYQFDDMHLHVGDRFQLEAGGARHYGTLIGYVPGQSVVVKTPLVDGLPVTYTDGQAVTVRAFTGKGIFAFDTTIDRVCIAPFHYLHLAFPSSVRGVQIRAGERIRVCMPTQIKLGEHTIQPGIVTDLGIGGAAIEVERPLILHDKLSLSLRFALEDMHLTAGFDAPGVVHKELESRSAEGTTLHRYGVAFEGITLGQTVMLQNFVYHQLLADHQLMI